MSNIALSGLKTRAELSSRGALVEGDGIAELDPNEWYEVAAFAAVGSQLPGGVVSFVFRTPDTTETPIVPIVGDDVYKLTLTRICKTDAEVSFEEGTIDVTDDCEEGFNANILDDYRGISGTLNGFMKYNDDTGELSTNSKALFNRFLNLVVDDGAGGYTVTATANEKVLLFICLNKNAAVGDKQNWIIVPAILSGLGSGAGLKDAQKRDITWTKAQGYVSLYQRTVFAADVI